MLVNDMPLAAKVYANDDRDYASRVTSLASLYADVGKLDTAVSLLHETRDAIALPGRPPSGPSLTMARLEADLLGRSGKAERATEALRDVITMRRRYYGPSIALAVDLLYLARILNVRDRPTEALAALREAGPMAIEHFGPNSQPVVQIELARVDSLTRLGRVEEARARFASIDPVASRLTGGGLNAIRYLRVDALLAGVSGDHASALRKIIAARNMAEKLGPGGEALFTELAATREVVIRSAQKAR
jgi:tetratricopeptide (TPR) repeat protein